MNLDPATRQRIDDLVKNNRVLLFMKGDRGYPQCGFSAHRRADPRQPDPRLPDGGRAAPTRRSATASRPTRSGRPSRSSTSTASSRAAATSSARCTPRGELQQKLGARASEPLNAVQRTPRASDEQATALRRESPWPPNSRTRSCSTTASSATCATRWRPSACAGRRCGGGLAPAARCRCWSPPPRARRPSAKRGLRRATTCTWWSRIRRTARWSACRATSRSSAPSRRPCCGCWPSARATRVPSAGARCASRSARRSRCRPARLSREAILAQVSASGCGLVASAPLRSGHTRVDPGCPRAHRRRDA